MQNVHVVLANLSGANLRGNRTEIGESREKNLKWGHDERGKSFENLEK